jgi:hypothetical protein
MLNKSLYRLSFLSANFFLLNFAIIATDQDSIGILIEPAKVHQLQEMYFLPDEHPAHKSQFHEQFDLLGDIEFS